MIATNLLYGTENYRAIEVPDNQKHKNRGDVFSPLVALVLKFSQPIFAAGKSMNISGRGIEASLNGVLPPYAPISMILGGSLLSIDPTQSPNVAEVR